MAKRRIHSNAQDAMEYAFEMIGDINVNDERYKNRVIREIGKLKILRPRIRRELQQIARETRCVQPQRRRIEWGLW